MPIQAGHVTNILGSVDQNETGKSLRRGTLCEGNMDAKRERPITGFLTATYTYTTLPVESQHREQPSALTLIAAYLSSARSWQDC